MTAYPNHSVNSTESRDLNQNKFLNVPDKEAGWGGTLGHWDREVDTDGGRK